MNNNILETRGLCKNFLGFTAVEKVDLTVRRGEIHALIGPNGAGKTTLFNLLTRFQDASAGEIFFNGTNITRLSPIKVAHLGVIRSFQISAVFPSMTVLENVRLALQRTAGSSFSFWRSERSLNRLNARCEEILEAVGLSEFLEHSAGSLAYGRKRALELATTVAMDPALMLLDEPTQGMGYEDVDRITDLIAKVAVGRTVLMVEHNMKVVSRIADRLSVLQRGRLIASGSYDQVSADPAVMEAYMGEAVEQKAEAV